MYEYEIKKTADKKLGKLARRNPQKLDVIFKKIEEICLDPYRFKNLKRPLQNFKRVQFDNQTYILVFSIDEITQTVYIENYDHHDKIYQQMI
jgi:mRNA-degrading endonuclease RelE of RelBE toxin-antitoxin system